MFNCFMFFARVQLLIQHAMDGLTAQPNVWARLTSAYWVCVDS
jgi:hypothetical protein